MLVRKLVLRGYNVRVLARNQAQVVGILPSSVGIVEGDISSLASLREAVEGVDKASCCAHRRGIVACLALPAWKPERHRVQGRLVCRADAYEATSRACRLCTVQELRSQRWVTQSWWRSRALPDLLTNCR